MEGAAAYARGLGFSPHPNYHKAKLLFGTIDPGECAEEFEFGKDGMPFFISGPNDTVERCRQIVSTLTHSCGPGGFHYFVGVGNPGAAVPESLEWDSDDDEDDEAPAAPAG